MNFYLNIIIFYHSNGLRSLFIFFSKMKKIEELSIFFGSRFPLKMIIVQEDDKQEEEGKKSFKIPCKINIDFSL